jgi:hypothetical protein
MPLIRTPGCLLRSAQQIPMAFHPGRRIPRRPLFARNPNPKETLMFVPYDPDFMKKMEEMNVEILESYVPDSRLHEILNNPYEEGITEG